MIKYHPSEWDIEHYIAGDISPAKSLIMAAHIDMCRCCAIRAENSQYRQSKTLEVSQNQDAFDGMRSMMEAITDNENVNNSVQHLPIVSPNESPVASGVSVVRGISKTLQLEGKKFAVPNTLARYISCNAVWSKYLGKVWQLPINVGGGYLAYFIYLEGGGYVPEHTHAGTEMTLVIDGQFSDGIGTYNQGDMVNFDSSDTHTPVTNEGEGCLIFTIIDEPLSFTSGWAKVINPLSNLYFKFNTSKA